MANRASIKGNPASTRMSNTNLKARRARCWLAGEKRKAARREAQEAARRANVASAFLSPWLRAKAARRARRAAERAA